MRKIRLVKPNKHEMKMIFVENRYDQREARKKTHTQTAQ